MKLTMKSQAVVCLAITLLFLATFGCSRSKEKHGTPAAEKTTSQPEAAAGKGGQRTKIKIGVILPLTGPVSRFGGWLQDGIDFAASRVKDVDVVYEDSRGQAATAVAAFRKLVGVEKVDGMLVAQTQVAYSVTPIAETEKMPTVLVFADLPSGSHSMVSNYHYPVTDEVGALARFAVGRKWTRGAILVVADEFGRLSADKFAGDFTRHGGKVVFRDTIPKDANSLRSLLLKLKGVGHDFLFVVAYDKMFAALTRTLTEQGQKEPLLGPNVLSVYLGAASVRPGDLYVSMSVFGTNHEPAVAGEFRTAYEKKYGSPPLVVQAEGYEAFRFMVNSLKTGKERRNISMDGIMGRVRFDSRGQAHFPLVVTRIDRSGKQTTMKEYSFK